MTLKELCEKIGYSENTLKRSFKRTKENLEKNKGIIITKTGYGDTADYQLEYDETLIIKKPSKQKVHTELIGKRFGHLVVLEDSGERFHRGVVWKCKCDCGNIKNIWGNRLTQNKVQSCGDSECPYHRRFDDLTGQRFGKLVALYPTIMRDGSHMYWMCQCDCGNQIEISSTGLKRGTKSCGCIKTSIGEKNIENILLENNIKYKKEISFDDLTYNKFKLRYDFGIFQNDKLIRLIEFDGIQHFEKQDYFTHSLEETQRNDRRKNRYAIEHNIPLVRIPYWERDNITLEMIMGDNYLI